MRAGPPQMQAADFQPRDVAIARSLRQEMKKAALVSPFMSTTLGCRSNSCADRAAATEPFELAGVLPETVATAGPGYSMPAALHAEGLLMPARMRAAAILPCWVRSVELPERFSGERLITCTCGLAETGSGDSSASVDSTWP